ncbi:MAG: PAS domain S-box protein [Candidatus Protistobacter heckmanni]|nr:PAS domain S-box protein [Candidatus Protistobacter heckmanni]
MTHARSQRRARRNGWGDLFSGDNFRFLAPLVAIALFAIAMGAVLWTLHTRDIQQQDALYRDVAWTQQKMRLNLTSKQDQMASLARELSSGQLQSNAYRAMVQDILREHPEIVMINLLDDDRRLRWALPSGSPLAMRLRETRDHPMDVSAGAAFVSARENQRPAYSKPFNDDNGASHVYYVVPIVHEGEFIGALGAVFSTSEILSNLIPAELTDTYRFSLLRPDGATLASTTPNPLPASAASFEVTLDPPGNSLALRATAYPHATGLVNRMLLWLTGGLSVFLMWSLWVLWRQDRQRRAAQQALLDEMSFRRAMENSLVLGMRALDMNGRITYVNPAFCRMTGWSESDLVGKTAPFVYWPRSDFAELQRYLELTLMGQAPSTGFQMRVQRKDGSTFFGRMYVSPLVDSNNRQTGWMSSLADITEPKRAREDLAAAQERFTTVLESLDACVSVLAPGNSELLFANRYYRQLFGTTPKGHLELSDSEFDPGIVADEHDDFIDGYAGLPASALTLVSAAREIYLPSLQKWFDVRRRYIQWVDGHLAQVIIATDISARKSAEEMAHRHEQELQFASRLTTMGEMTSSLAHELNQPLAAIANYCMGAVARLKSGSVAPADLLPILEKTTNQAQRAGTIISRIRAFVKRSLPQQRAVDLHEIVADAVGLAEIDAGRKLIRIVAELPPRLPKIYVDPLLIEQVLVNLFKNAAEAMAPTRRGHGTIRLEAELGGEEAAGNIWIKVIDQGPGVDESLKERLFEPFFTTKTDGMGMGLNICRSIIESHKGRLWVENNPGGKGATFHILLPMDPEIYAAEDLGGRPQPELTQTPTQLNTHH